MRNMPPAFGVNVIVGEDGAMDYPFSPIPPGERGVVIEANADIIRVRMEKEFPELADWENCIELYRGQFGEELLADFNRRFITL